MEATKTHEEMRAELIGRATRDEAFRQRLVEDPKAAIKEALGLDLPGSLTVSVHEDTATAAHLVLPPRPTLTEGELEGVAAGHDVWSHGMYRGKKLYHRH